MIFILHFHQLTAYEDFEKTTWKIRMANCPSTTKIARYVCGRLKKSWCVFIKSSYMEFLWTLGIWKDNLNCAKYKVRAGEKLAGTFWLVYALLAGLFLNSIAASIYEQTFMLACLVNIPNSSMLLVGFFLSQKGRYDCAAERWFTAIQTLKNMQHGPILIHLLSLTHRHLWTGLYE